MIRTKKKKIVPFDIFNATVMTILVFCFVLPFWIILATSLSDNSRLQTEGVAIWFKGFEFSGYIFLFSMSDIFVRALGVSALTSLITAVLSVAVCTLAAYALSKKNLLGRKLFNVYLMVTMFFSGGTIPTYLIIRGIGIYNTVWALILPSVATTYNILIIRNYFYGLPSSLEEAAQLDGASVLQVLFYIYVPLALPIMFTVALTSFVGKWNEWLPSLLYLGAEHNELWSVQYVLRQMLRDMQSLYGNTASGAVVNAPLISAKNAGIVIVVLPLVLISPVLHRFFVSGITAGSVKG